MSDLDANAYIEWVITKAVDSQCDHFARAFDRKIRPMKAGGRENASARDSLRFEALCFLDDLPASLTVKERDRCLNLFVSSGLHLFWVGLLAEHLRCGHKN